MLADAAGFQLLLVRHLQVGILGGPALKAPVLGRIERQKAIVHVAETCFHVLRYMYGAAKFPVGLL